MSNAKQTLTCLRCGQTKPISKFPNILSYKPESGKCLVCSECGGKKAIKKKIVKDARSVPCMDCKRTYPIECMGFDHLPQYEKCFNICWELSSHTIQEVYDEIAKCEVVCANCHRIRTANRKRKSQKEF